MDAIPRLALAPVETGPVRAFHARAASLCVCGQCTRADPLASGMTSTGQQGFHAVRRAYRGDRQGYQRKISSVFQPFPPSLSPLSQRFSSEENSSILNFMRMGLLTAQPSLAPIDERSETPCFRRTCCLPFLDRGACFGVGQLVQES